MTARPAKGRVGWQPVIRPSTRHVAPAKPSHSAAYRFITALVDYIALANTVADLHAGGLRSAGEGRHVVDDVGGEAIRADQAIAVDVGGGSSNASSSALVKAPCCQAESSRETSLPLEEVSTVMLAAASSVRRIVESIGKEVPSIVIAPEWQASSSTSTRPRSAIFTSSCLKSSIDSPFD